MTGFSPLFFLVAASLLPWSHAAPIEPEQSQPAAPTIIERNYVVKLRPGLASDTLDSHIAWVNHVHAQSLGKRSDDGVTKTYNMQEFQAYAGAFDEQTIEAIKHNPDVDTVENDQFWYSSNLTIQLGAPWGLATISHRGPDAHSYLYTWGAGTNTYGYIIDSGINYAHIDFDGRAVAGYNAAGGNFFDTLGHGTHVAGIVGGRTFGVAKNTTLVAVRVFEGGGASSMSIILDAYSWAVNDIIAKKREGQSVINLSLGGGFSGAFNAAIDAAYALGIVTVVAAGNEGQDASAFSPASAARAVTVGAMDSSWRMASYSNYGTGVDLFAPGSGVMSTFVGSVTATATLSGTSMAAPHVAGLVLYLQSVEGLRTPDAIVKRLLELATQNRMGGLPDGTPNLVGFNGIDGTLDRAPVKIE